MLAFIYLSLKSSLNDVNSTTIMLTPSLELAASTIKNKLFLLPILIIIITLVTLLVIASNLAFCKPLID